MQRTTNLIVNMQVNVVDDSLKSTARTLSCLEDTKKIGAETLDTLHHQGEQLIRIQKSEDEILVDQKIAGRYIASIHGLFATLFNRFRPDPSKIDNVKKGDKVIAKHKRKSTSKKQLPDNTNPNMESLIDFSMLSDEDREKIKRTNQNIELIGEGVDQLKEMAVAMGDELDQHNQRLEILKQTTEEASNNLSILERRM